MNIGKLTIRKLKTVRDAKLAVVFSWESYRLRIDWQRVAIRDGWQVKVARLHIWKNLQYGIFTPTREIYEREWVL